MKIVTASYGKAKVTLSKRDWLSIGKQAGWIKKQAMNYPATVDHTFVFNNREYDVSVSIRVTGISNSGIGSYEFWGAKGFDRGHDFVSDFEIESVRSNNEEIFSPEEERQLISFLNHDKKLSDKVSEEVSVDDVKSYYEDMKTEAILD